MALRKVLVGSPVSTQPPHSGNGQRILQIARLLRDNGFDVELAVGRNTEVSDEAKQVWSVIQRLKCAPRWRPRTKYLPLNAWSTPGLGEELAEIVERQKIDVVLLNYIYHSKLLEHLPRGVTKIIDTHDVFTNRREPYVGYRYTGSFFSCTSEDEATYLSRADLALSISPDDTKKFRELVPQLPVVDILFLFVAHKGKPTNKSVVATLHSDNKTVGVVLSANDLNVASLPSFIAAFDNQCERTPLSMSLSREISTPRQYEPSRTESRIFRDHGCTTWVNSKTSRRSTKLSMSLKFPSLQGR